MKRIYISLFFGIMTTAIAPCIPETSEEARSLRQAKSVVTTLTEQLDKNIVTDSLSRTGSALKNAILYGKVLDAKKYQELIRFSLINRKLLWTKIPALLTEFVMESVETIIHFMQQQCRTEALYADYQDIKNKICSYICNIFAFSPVDKTKNQPMNTYSYSDEKINELLQAFNYDYISPLLTLFVIRALPEHQEFLQAEGERNSLLQQIAIQLRAAFVRTVKKYLTLEEINNMLSFFQGPTYKALAGNSNNFLDIIGKNINPAIKDVFSQIKHVSA